MLLTLFITCWPFFQLFIKLKLLFIVYYKIKIVNRNGNDDIDSQCVHTALIEWGVEMRIFYLFVTSIQFVLTWPIKTLLVGYLAQSEICIKIVANPFLRFINFLATTLATHNAELHFVIYSWFSCKFQWKSFFLDEARGPALAGRAYPLYTPLVEPTVRNWSPTV